MKRKNDILNGMLFSYCVLAAAVSLWFFTGRSIALDQPKTIRDNDRLYTMMEQNIPVRIRISNKRWGSREITSKQQVLTLWERIDAIPQAGFSQETAPLPFRASDAISGSVTFLNGDTDFFEISNYIRRNGLLYGDSTTSFEISLLYNELEARLFTLENLEMLVSERAKRVSISDGAGRKTDLTGRQRQELSRRISRSQTVAEGRDKGPLQALVALYLEKGGFLDGDSSTDTIVWIAIYDGGYAEVNNLQTGGVILRLTGPLSEYCLQFLEQHEAADGAR